MPLQKRTTKLMITQDTIDRVPCIRLFEFTTEEEKFIQHLHKEVLIYAMNKNESNEVGILVDMRTWESILIKGNRNSIDMGNSERARELLKTAPNRSLIFLHNHPNNTIFSSNDLRSFCANESLFMMTAICNNGNIHVLAKGFNFSPAAVMLAHNKGVSENKGIQNMIKQSRHLGVLYKFGRCRKK